MKKFVKIKKNLDYYSLWIEVGNQSFQLAYTCDRKKDAEWYQKMLCIALEKAGQDFYG